MVLSLNYVGKDSSGTFYVSFRDPGQILKIRDCPGDSGTVGAYAASNDKRCTNTKIHGNKISVNSARPDISVTIILPTGD